MLLVTYGTLKRGHGNNRILQTQDSKFVSECTVRGYKLYDSGFPVASESAGDTISGELWDIGDVESNPGSIATLNRLDGLEGFRGNDNPTSMYFRHEIVAHTSDGQFDANIYVGSPTFWRGFQGMRTEKQDETGTYYWDR